jgi:hypothetical protein
VDGTPVERHDHEIKVAYVKGIGNMADFRDRRGGSPPPPQISKGFVDELKTKTIAQVIAEVDKYIKRIPTSWICR